MALKEEPERRETAFYGRRKGHKLRAMRSGVFQWTAKEAVDWRLPWLDWPGTRYEAKAKREGRTPSYLTFERQITGS